MNIKCPKCNHIFPKPKKQHNGIEEFKIEQKRFKEKCYKGDAEIILTLLKRMKKESSFGLTIDQACETLSELGGYSPRSIREIADYVKYRTGDICLKHINYFRQIARSKVAEPQIIQRTQRMRIN